LLWHPQELWPWHPQSFGLELFGIRKSFNLAAAAAFSAADGPSSFGGGAGTVIERVRVLGAGAEGATGWRSFLGAGAEGATGWRSFLSLGAGAGVDFATGWRSFLGAGADLVDVFALALSTLDLDTLPLGNAGMPLTISPVPPFFFKRAASAGVMYAKR
jgi:hypothetical protein